jgi:hypothetical protein
MGTNRRPSLTQCTAWAMVIGGHLLLFLLFSNSRPRDIRITESGSVLLLLDLTPPPTKLPATAERSATTRARSAVVITAEVQETQASAGVGAGNSESRL